MPKRSATLFAFLLLCTCTVSAQTYYAWDSGTFYEFSLPDLFCGDETCALEEIGQIPFHDFAFCPNGLMYGLDGGDNIYQVDPVTLDATLILDSPMPISSDGLVCRQDTLFYFLGAVDGLLYEMNINAGTITLIGDTGFDPHEGLLYFQGEYYFPADGAIVHLNIEDPANSAIAVVVPPEYIILGMTSSPFCNILIGRDINGDSLFAINLIDGSFTPICEVSNSFAQIFTSGSFEMPVCTTAIDLDCDDSSGAPDADYFAPGYSCQTDPIGIADADLGIMADASILFASVTLLTPVPDDPFEYLSTTGPTPNINISGEGTSMITFSNAGSATIANFKQAIRSVLYNNGALSPTAGPRIVQVQLSTASGSTSNIASAFINIIELEQLNVNIGPDQVICDSETITLDAGNPGATYAWSTSDNTQTIVANQSGMYSVTVSDDIHCPGADTMELNVIPLIHVELTGDLATCQNSPASLALITNSTIPLDIEVALSTGGTFSFLNVTGNLTFSDDPTTNTTYEIISVTGDQPFCLNITDSVQTVQVFPTYFSEMNAGLCGGDSIWLAYYWEHNAGVYNIQLTSEYGCDSIILYTIESVPADFILIQTNTCDPSQAGVFITTLPNANGCDTIVQQTVTLQYADTTNVSDITCRLSQAGTDTMTLSNIYGCDSLVITGVQYIPPSDTTKIMSLTCDPSELGETLTLFTASDGCDSLVLVQTMLAPTDTTYLDTTTCNPSMIGVTSIVLGGSDGCDSILITTTTGIAPDTTFIHYTTCDVGQVGTTTDVFTTALGCDSIVVTTVTFSLQDTTYLNGITCDASMTGTFYENFVTSEGCDSIVATTLAWLPPVETSITSTTCDPLESGVFIDTLTGYLGCDSIVREAVSLLPSSGTALFETTCSSVNAGVFTTLLTNQYGCDSIVTLTVTLLPSDTTWIVSQTCHSSEIDTIATTLTDQFGCDSLVLNAISLFAPTVIQLQSVFDYHGYDVSCADADDGAIITTVNGTAPFQFAWSSGEDVQDLENVVAGIYTITVTDGNGCESSQQIELNAPPELTANFEVGPLDCAEDHTGSVVITPLGGVPGYQYALVGFPFQNEDILTGLADGIHACVVKDANDCEVNGIVRIDLPLLIDIELGDDQMIQNGEEASLNALINIPPDSIAGLRWYTLTEELCDGCTSLEVAPLLTTTYYAGAESIDGCIDIDSVTIHVIQDKEVYIPNVFTPNGDGINDRLVIMTKPNVTEIARMEIFDRWGNAVYTKSDLPPNDQASAWDGTWEKKPLNPGVFVYRVVVGFIDGSQAVYQGDVTLIR